MGCDLAQVAVVPGWLDGSEDCRGFGMGGVLSDAEAVAVCVIDAEAGVAALVYDALQDKPGNVADHPPKSQIP